MDNRPQGLAIAEVLSRYVEKRGPDECWPWQRARMKRKGYGVFGVGQSTKLAHRAAYEIHHGVTLSPGEVVRHRCDNPPCCNPAHLIVGTQLDNIRDMDERGRARRGANNRGVRKHSYWPTDLTWQLPEHPK